MLTFSENSCRRRSPFFWLPALLICATALTACFGPEKDTHPDQVLTKRRALFKQYTRMLEPIGLVASGRKEFKREEFLAAVQDLEKLSDKPWAYFPPDGNYPPTHATGAVWSEPAKFRQAQDDYKAAVHALVEAAGRDPLPEISKAVDAVTASCKACHREFRKD